jgi:GAF domain-containing protein
LERRRLARENRELVAHLTQAQKELAERRARELTQVRQIGETLVGPLSWDQLSQGLVKLIWNSFPVQLLGLAISGPLPDLPQEAFQRRPDIPDAGYQTFQGMLKGQLTADLGAPAPRHVGAPLPAMLWHKVAVEDVTLVAGAGRREPFTPEEAELFRIFILQGEAGIKNLALFERVKGLAIRDGLTGLHNYRYFRETLLHEVERSHRYNMPLSLLSWISMISSRSTTAWAICKGMPSSGRWVQS